MLAVEALKEADGSLVVLSRIGGGSSQVGGWILGVEISPLEGGRKKAAPEVVLSGAGQPTWIVDGDKRLLVIDGEPIPDALARVPARGELRGNLAAGAEGEGRELTERDRWIAEQVGPTLKERGLIFVGLDVIGDYLTEINVTCPTCIREIDAQKGLDIAGDYLDFITETLL